MKQRNFSTKDLEQYSSAITLSDMEIFIFPDLMYALVLANIMSPEIWKWRTDPWFDKIEKKSFNYRINRVKQYIMDHYVFNLDLDTWGLTQKATEIDRFKDFVDLDVLKNSNALFGYEGDRYYFGIDIRRHFGLDAYQDDVIPYWKTETVEAMNAFKYKEGYSVGAGECVSLSALYVAAMFIVGRIPLEKMFLIATPLHSQNFIAENDGFITNNRRIVTKNMWFNGTELSAKARRAVENEKITIISHISGCIHTAFPLATISKEALHKFKDSFLNFLRADLTFETFVNFLYSKEAAWTCFQYEHIHNGKPCYTSIKNIFNAQKTSKNRFAGDSRAALLGEMEVQEFSKSPLKNKIIINHMEDYLKEHADESFKEKENYFFNELLREHCENIAHLFHEIEGFLHIKPKLPLEDEKIFEPQPTILITTEMERDEIISLVEEAAATQLVPSLAMYSYRAMDKISWTPFMKAAIERNTALTQKFKDVEWKTVIDLVQKMDNESIYSECRLAQPDEVYNFNRGDGLEKAILLTTLALYLDKTDVVSLFANNDDVVFESEKRGKLAFSSSKKLVQKLQLSYDKKGLVVHTIF